MKLLMLGDSTQERDRTIESSAEGVRLSTCPLGMAEAADRLPEESELAEPACDPRSLQRGLDFGVDPSPLLAELGHIRLIGVNDTVECLSAQHERCLFRRQPCS